MRLAGVERMAPKHRTQLMDVERRLLLGALCAGMALAGCGASRSATTTSRSERAPTVSEPVPTESIEVSIPTLLREGYIPKRYTCVRHARKEFGQSKKAKK